MSRSGSHHAAARLEYRVFTATRPGLTRDIPAGYESLAWVANSATLIYGTRDAVLVDTFLTLDQSVQLADEVAASGKNLTHVYITHGHGDHFFGLGALKQRFTDVRAVATAADDPKAIAQTRQYLRDFIRLDEATDTARQLFDAMIELYPDRANPGSLWGGANAAKR